jgi:arginine/lysine/ornithine decarboxylase
MGAGVLFMLGVGTRESDIDALLTALERFDQIFRAPDSTRIRIASSKNASYQPLPPIEQILAPRKASLSPSRLVSRKDSENHIAAETIAPCPPGIPLCVPGQKLSKEVIKHIKKQEIRIVS